MKGIAYQFSGDAWQHGGAGSWFFVTLPKPMSSEIRNIFKSEEEGWGRLKVTAKIGNTEWKTSIWFDSKRRLYLLPLKSEIRKKQKITAGKNIEVSIWI